MLHNYLKNTYFVRGSLITQMIHYVGKRWISIGFPNSYFKEKGKT